MRAFHFSFVAVAAIIVCGSAAWGADQDDVPDAATGGYYGNVHGGIFGSFSDTEGQDIRLPGLTMGGKIGFDSGESPWGWQVDTDYSYVDFDWIRPSITDVNGHISTTDSAAHLTYRSNANSKLGLFAGYGTITLGVEDTSGGTFDLFDETGLTEASMTLGVTGFGVEGLTELGEDTWVQGKLGMIDLMYLSIEGSNGVSSVKVSDTDFLGDDVGLAASASLHHWLTDNIVGRAEASYAVLGLASDTDMSTMGVAVGANYIFDGMPLSIGVSGGYTRIDVDGASADGFNGSTKLTYSFGGRASGSTGKLFRSGAIGFTPN